MLRGIPPEPALRSSDVLQQKVIERALGRAAELRQQELDYLATQIARALAGKG